MVQRREFCCAIPWMRVKSAHSKFGCAKRLSSPKKEESRVCTYLFDVKYEDVKDPLSQFQLTLATEGDTKKLIVSINRALSVNVQLSTERLDKAFAMWWPELHKRLSGISKPAGPAMPERPDSDKISEILTRVRALEGVLVSREISASTAAVAPYKRRSRRWGRRTLTADLKYLANSENWRKPGVVSFATFRHVQMSCGTRMAVILKSRKFATGWPRPKPSFKQWRPRLML